MKVAIDPGHGGKDPGAAKGDIQEKEVVMEIADYLIDELQDKDYEVLRTRKKDKLIGLYHRPSMAHEWGADIFVSLHINAADNLAAKGTEVIYYKGQEESLELAEAIQNELVNSLNRPDRGVKPNKSFVVLEQCEFFEIPAVIVEPMFVTNEIERSMLGKKEYLILIAQAIFDGIEKYRKG
ncbi:MAG: N-acetylmuramoyl-L-alanine amidase [Bacteroidales bacterium]